MARRRFQTPTPFKEGRFWWIKVRQDEFQDGKLKRIQKRLKVAPAATGTREAQRMASELLRPMNQNLISVGSATPFSAFVETVYKTTVMPLLAAPTRKIYQCYLKTQLLPKFGDMPLRDLTPLVLQKYFSGLEVGHPSAMKIKDVLASVVASAKQFQMLIINPMNGLKLLPARKGKRIKPHIKPEEFVRLIDYMQEPYATMVLTDVLSGLRVSELIGLKLNDLLPSQIVVDERFCRGDWSQPKTEASNAAVDVDPRLIERILSLKDKSVTINWGGKGAKRTIKLRRSTNPDDLVFQSVVKGGTMSDGNILRRHIKPAARKVGLGLVNWQVLRRSFATWVIEAGSDPKSLQAQMRHSDPELAMLIYAQVVRDSQKKSVSKMTTLLSEHGFNWDVNVTFPVSEVA